MNKACVIVWLTVTALAATGAGAQSTVGISVKAAVPQPLSLPAKVDRLFERAEYDRAYLIYRNELASRGDKYAQYMVGYMHLTGMGAEQDLALASAWYRLSAERGTPEFVALRDQVMQELPAEQRDQSDAFYRQLRYEFSDLAVLLRSIKRHVHEFKARSGAGVTGTPAAFAASGSQTSIRASDNGMRIRMQLRKLATIGEFKNLETDPSKIDLEELERLVNQRIAATGP